MSLLESPPTALEEFRIGLEEYLIDRYARPFVCTGSPLRCRAFVVGYNAATKLDRSFSCYWSDEAGFDRDKFDADYGNKRRRAGNRPRIEAIAAQIAPCLETNLYAIPSMKAKKLALDDRSNPVVSYLFRAIKPEVVYVHSKAAIAFFETETKCDDFTSNPKRARWQGHDFWLFGRPGPLYTMSIEKAECCGKMLAGYLGVLDYPG